MGSRVWGLGFGVRGRGLGWGSGIWGKGVGVSVSGFKDDEMCED